jgi:hypothetical protein
MLGGMPQIRQISVPGNQAAGPGWMSMGGGQGGGSPYEDASARALHQYGPNGLLALQMMHAMMKKGPLGLMDPQNAKQWFTPQTIGGLAPKYQEAFAAKQGKK